jgi:hypothetical protein
MRRWHGYSPVAFLGRILTKAAGTPVIAYDFDAAETLGATAHCLAENAVGVLPVTWRNACENAGTLA